MKIPWISDIYVKTCWSPCFWHSNVRSGSFAIAVYTIAMSVVVITYLIGESNIEERRARGAGNCLICGELCIYIYKSAIYFKHEHGKIVVFPSEQRKRVQIK